MRKSAITTGALRRWLLAACLALASAAVLRADEAKEELTPEQQKLAKQARALNAKAIEYYQRGEFVKAIPLLKEVLTIGQQVYSKERYPAGHPDLATSLNNLGGLLQAQGAFEEARPYVEQALAMRQRLYAKDKYPAGHPDLATSLNSLGFLLQAQGAFEEARPYVEQALAMRQRLYPKDQYPAGHPDLAASLNNLGSLLQAQAAYGEARPYFEQALAMVQRLYPKDQYPAGHPDLAASLNNLGFLLQAQAAYGEARPYFEQALAMIQRLYAKDKYPAGHPDLATSLNNLGGLLQAQGAFEEARPYVEQALAMRQRLYAKDKYPAGHPDLANSLNSLGFLLQAQGAFEEARPYVEQALAMRQRLYAKDKYPAGHPHLANSLNNLGGLLQAQGAFEEARPYVEQALAIYQDLADAFAATAAEADQLNRLAALPLTRDGYLCVTRRLDADAYPAVFRSKAAVARMLERRHEALLLTSDPEHRDLGRQLADTRRELAALMLAPAGSRPDLADRVKGRTKDKEVLERKLARALPAFAALKERDNLGVDDLRAKLPPRTAFVDLLRYWYMERDKDKPRTAGEKWTESYVAFVLVAGKPTRRIELGPAEPIEQAALTWRRAIVAGGKEVDDREAPAAATLRRLVWAPLAKEIPADTEAIYLAPDGALTGLPWAALPGSKPGTVLLEDHALAVVPHGRYLLERLLDPPAANPEKGLLLAVGGVGYGDAPAPLTEVAAAEKLRAAETGGKTITWKDLPGTAREVERVLALAGKRDARPRRGAEASTERLVRELPEARWVHLATHGFFADGSVRSALRLSEEDYKRSQRGERVGAGARNPLVLSGLVLAGANRTGDSAAPDRGILTAEAVAGMFLDKMDLAVLSACETGLGEVAGGEGVFGLQRAFHIAGAKNVVASLWKVDDNATAALMGLFYRKLWQEKLPPIEALRQAQLAIYRSSPAEIADLATRSWDVSQPVKVPDGGPAVGKRGRAPTKQWAAFVLSGAGR